MQFPQRVQMYSPGQETGEQSPLKLKNDNTMSLH